MAKLNREELETKAIKFVMDFYKVTSNRPDLEKKWTNIDCLYNLQEPSKVKSDGTKANVHTPDLRRAFQTIVDFVVDVLFPPTSDWFRLKPVDDDADIKNADIYKKIADLQNEKIALRAKVIKGVHRWVKYGFLLTKNPRVYKDKYIIAEEKERTAFKGILKSFFNGIVKKFDPTSIPKKTEKVVYDNLDFQPKSPWDMFWNYNIPWEEQEIVIEKIKGVTASHLRAQKTKAIYNDNVDLIIESLETEGETGDKAEDITEKYPHLSEITGLTGDFTDNKPRATLLQADCYFDIDQDGYDELCIITVAVTKPKNTTKVNAELIRMELNDSASQDFPVKFVAWDELEDMSLGMGVFQIGEKDQLSLNTHARQLMDNITEINNPTKLIDKGLLKEGQNLNRWHDKVLEFEGDPNTAIFYDRPPSIGNEILAAINMDKSNIQNGTRANISLQGLAARYDTTATEYTSQGSSASRGIMSQIKNFEDAILKTFLKDQYSSNLQYLSRENIVAICGKKAALAMLKIENSQNQKEAKDVIMGDYDFIPLGVTQTENKVIRGQQLLNAITTAVQVETIKPGTVDIAFLFKKFWDVTGDGDDRILLPQATDEALFPQDENILFAQGAELDVNPEDNDEEHAQIHMSEQFAPENQKNVDKHLKQHAIQAQKKAMQAQMAQIQQMLATKGKGQGTGKQNPNFAPKPPMPGNNGGVPGVVRPPVGI